MNQKLRHRSILALALLTMIALMLSGSNCQNPSQRPGNSFDGSAHWARDIAQPLINNFAADAQIYHINGVQVFEDGRLPANAGSWGLVAWSPSRQEIFQVNVRFNGATSTTTRSQATPPGASDQPLPDNWVNSTVIFDATASHRDPSATLATLAAFNLPTYSGPHWGINFNAGQEPNHYVNSDGTYLGTTP